MKISKKTLSKWDIQEIKAQKSLKRDEFRIKSDTNTAEINKVFSLPKCVLEEPKLSRVNMLTIPKKISYQSYLQNGEVQAMQTMQREYYNQLRNTIKHKTSELYKPIKKHHSVIDTFKVQNEEQKPIMKLSKKAPISIQHSSQKALNILQKIILKQVDFYANKKKTILELQASKLPIIEYKQSKRKQSLAAYEALYSPHHAALIKYQSLHVKSPRPSVKKQIQTPFLSGWDINQPNDF